MFKKIIILKSYLVKINYNELTHSPDICISKMVNYLKDQVRGIFFKADCSSDSTVSSFFGEDSLEDTCA